MDLDLDAIEARLETYWNDPDFDVNERVQDHLIRDVPGLVAEVRRLRAALDSREHTQTVGMAAVVDPEAVLQLYQD